MRQQLASIGLLLTACGAGGPGVANGTQLVKSCRYDVHVVSQSPLRLQIDAECRGVAVRGLEADDARVADHIAEVQDGARQLERRGNAFMLPQPAPRAHFRYDVNLEQLAQQNDLDLALRSGDAVLAPSSSFLLYPLPLDLGIEVSVHFHTSAEVTISSGLMPKQDHFEVQAHELGVATYTAFGRQSRRELRVDAAKLELAILDGALALSTDDIAAWAQRSADAVSKFYGVPPAPHTSVFVLPVSGKDSVVFGKLLPESSPGIALLLGSNAAKAALDQDWVLVHELFHVGVPSFYGEGKWFDEGLATYFEPIIRARSGLLDEVELWREFSLAMPRAEAVFKQRGLEQAKDYLEIYWGGATFCLLADVAIRQASQGRVGLEDGLRHVLRAGGQASEVWSLEKTLRLADEAFPEPVLLPLSARHARRATPIDLAGLFHDLGVQRVKNVVTLTDAAPLAQVRRALLAAH